MTALLEAALSPAQRRAIFAKMGRLAASSKLQKVAPVAFQFKKDAPPSGRKGFAAALKKQRSQLKPTQRKAFSRGFSSRAKEMRPHVARVLKAKSRLGREVGMDLKQRKQIRSFLGRIGPRALFERLSDIQRRAIFAKMAQSARAMSQQSTRLRKGGALWRRGTLPNVRRSREDLANRLRRTRDLLNDPAAFGRGQQFRRLGVHPEAPRFQKAFARAFTQFRRKARKRLRRVHARRFRGQSQLQTSGALDHGPSLLERLSDSQRRAMFAKMVRIKGIAPAKFHMRHASMQGRKEGITRRFLGKDIPVDKSGIASAVAQNFRFQSPDAPLRKTFADALRRRRAEVGKGLPQLAFAKAFTRAKKKTGRLAGMDLDWKDMQKQLSLDPNTWSVDINIRDGKGKNIGSMELLSRDGGPLVNARDIETGIRSADPGNVTNFFRVTNLGAAPRVPAKSMRRVLETLAQMFPKARTISGGRQTGARSDAFGRIGGIGEVNLDHIRRRMTLRQRLLRMQPLLPFAEALLERLSDSQRRAMFARMIRMGVSGEFLSNIAATGRRMGSRNVATAPGDITRVRRAEHLKDLRADLFAAVEHSVNQEAVLRWAKKHDGQEFQVPMPFKSPFGPRSGLLLVTQNTIPDEGPWRVTLIDPSGEPYGHGASNNYEEAVGKAFLLAGPVMNQAQFARIDKAKAKFVPKPFKVNPLLLSLSKAFSRARKEKGKRGRRRRSALMAAGVEDRGPVLAEALSRKQWAAIFAKGFVPGRGRGSSVKEMAGSNPLPRDLAKKTARGKAGQGKEIKLSFEETIQILAKGAVGIVSAGPSPHDKPPLSSKQLQERHDSLKNSLVDLGFKFVSGKGKYGGVPEDSLIVMATDANRKDMESLGKKFNQDSVIFSRAGSNSMIFTTGPNSGKRNVGKGFNIRTGAQDFFTQFRAASGKKFKFNMNFDFDRIVESVLSHLRSRNGKSQTEELRVKEYVR